MDSVAIVDITKFIENDKDESVQDLAKKIIKSFHETGILIIKDPRVNFEANEIFLNQMENYFNQSTEEKLKDARPELYYQGFYLFYQR
jgi:isopenicillin N synthase-like dioxygenase